jgi:hypothetical protein
MPPSNQPHESDRASVLVATVIFTILELLAARPNEPASNELPRILDLCSYVSEVQHNWEIGKGDSAGSFRGSADRPAVALTLVPIASSGAAAATVYAGLLLLYVFAAAVGRLAAPARSLYVRASGLLLAPVCADIAAAASGLTGKVETALQGQLGVVERWRLVSGRPHTARREAEMRSIVDELRRVMLVIVGVEEDAAESGVSGPEAKEAYTLAMGGVSTIIQTVGIIAGTTGSAG